MSFEINDGISELLVELILYVHTYLLFYVNNWEIWHKNQ